MRSWAAAILCVGTIVGLGVGRAQAAERGQAALTAIEIRGAWPELAGRLRGVLQLHTGDRLDGERLAADERRLWSSGLVDDVRVESEPRGDGVALVITVRPRRKLRQLTLGRGVDAELQAGLRQGFVTGQPIAPSHLALLSEDLRRIERLRGFPWAQPRVSQRLVGDDALDLDVDVDSGPRAFVTLVVRGARGIADADITRVVAQPIAWLDEEAKQRDLLTVQALYYDRGYIHARLSGAVVENRARRGLLVTLNVDEGEQYRLRDVRLGGGGPTGCEDASGNIFSRSRIASCIQSLEKRSGKKIDVRTKIDERARTIDLTLLFSDGAAKP